MYGWSPMSEAERTRRLELYDADLYLAKADASVFSERARRCISEALACYRNDLFLASANMLGAASEAIWHDIASSIADAGFGTRPLNDELGAPSPRIARIQKHVADALRAPDCPDPIRMPKPVVDWLMEVARYWREMRNYGMHEAGDLAPETYTEASLGVQLMSATGYLARLAGILHSIRTFRH
jgi:predicted trehalose synthase